ncbi:uncharacterized protein LOC126587037 [Malus sylvestris]|uniref:uncharacterized protein LOC126587037 n=1 Tax=Malus sylvestris TaxID=3752 RepID=UPI0021AC5777|nr:uncharacterized protein LOC126587037 [Malus sylvestris]
MIEMKGVIHPSVNSKRRFFASETRKWTERVALYPKNRVFFVGNLVQMHVAVVFDGMLYFLSDDGFVIGLDPYENYITPPPASPTSSSTTSTVDGNNYINCHFIDKPEGEDAVKSDFLGAFRSSSGSYMGMCLLVLDSSGSFRDLCAWDYVKDDQAAAGKCYWRLGGRVNLKRTLIEAWKTKVSYEMMAKGGTTSHSCSHGGRS